MRRLLLVLVLLVPIAAADHVFSHRLYVVGRVVDAEGAPAAGLRVEVEFDRMSAPSRCFDVSGDDVTGARGDFELCRHAHAIPPGTRAIVRAGGVAREIPVDGDLRHAQAAIQLEEVGTRDVNGQRQFERTYAVAGRSFVLAAQPAEVENVQVNATPRFDEVAVSLVAGGKVLASATAAPNEHGAYRADLAIGEIPAGALVRVEAGEDSSERLASPLFRRTDLHLVRDLRLAQGPGGDAPGSSATPVGGGLAAAALALTAFAAGARRPR